MENTIDKTNNTDTDKVITAKSFKTKSGVWPVLTIVITTSLIADR